MTNHPFDASQTEDANTTLMDPPAPLVRMDSVGPSLSVASSSSVLTSRSSSPYYARSNSLNRWVNAGSTPTVTTPLERILSQDTQESTTENTRAVVDAKKTEPIETKVTLTDESCSSSYSSCGSSRSSESQADESSNEVASASSSWGDDHSDDIILLDDDDDDDDDDHDDAKKTTESPPPHRPPKWMRKMDPPSTCSCLEHGLIVTSVSTEEVDREDIDNDSINQNLDTNKKEQERLLQREMQDKRVAIQQPPPLTIPFRRTQPLGLARDTCIIEGRTGDGGSSTSTSTSSSQEETKSRNAGEHPVEIIDAETAIWQYQSFDLNDETMNPREGINNQSEEHNTLVLEHQAKDLFSSDMHNPERRDDDEEKPTCQQGLACATFESEQTRDSYHSQIARKAENASEMVDIPLGNVDPCTEEAETANKAVASAQRFHRFAFVVNVSKRRSN